MWKKKINGIKKAIVNTKIHIISKTFEYAFLDLLKQHDVMLMGLYKKDEHGEFFVYVMMSSNINILLLDALIRIQKSKSDWMINCIA